MPQAAPALPVHRLHDEEIERLLATGERRRDLVALFGERGYRELSLLARRAAMKRARDDSLRVYVLPGLMGSRIGSRGVLLDDVLWVDLIEIAAGHLTRLALPGGHRLVALGAMLLNSLKLKLSLRIAGFDTHLHAFDWRSSIGQLAAALNDRIAAEAGGRSVALVGHSMGGVVARVALARQPSRIIRRVVQLGAPNHGSFAPVLALRGVYPTVRKLAALDRRHSAEDLARIIFRTLPALHELLPDPRLAVGPNLFDADAWPRDALQPDRTLLAKAAAEQAGWPAPDERCLHIAGVRQETVVGLRLRDQEFEYTLAAQGDATVPLALAVPPGQLAWYVGEKHGGLPNNGRVIAAAVDLLRTGTTRRLPQNAGPARLRGHRSLSEATLRRVAPHKVEWQQLSPVARRRLLEPVVSPEFHGAVAPTALAETLAVRRKDASLSRRRVLELRLDRSSIAHANARAVVLGVFRNVDPTGPAAALDSALGGAVRDVTLRRMFGGQLGQVFALPTARGALPADLVLFAGLGDFDDFGADALSFVAANVVRTLAQSHVEDFATVLFGAGSGIPAAMAAEHQLRGFVAGLREADPDQVVRRITFCEIDSRKYAALARSLRRMATALSDEQLELVVDEADVSSSARRRRAGTAGGVARHDPAYLLVTFEQEGRNDYRIRTALLTAGAKAAVLSGTRTLSRASLQRQLAPLESGKAGPRDLATIGESLARLLLAPTVREGLDSVRSRSLVVVHDREASRIPWEVLRIGGVHPALAGGLSRRYVTDALTVARWRDEPRAGEPLRMLLVVNPTLDLPGAATEGRELQALLANANVVMDVLEGREATRARLLAELAAGRFDVLHFAGHAFFDPAEPGRGGLVCAGEAVLHGSDLGDLGHLPALVFCNACEAARVRKRRPGAQRSAARWFGLQRTMTGVAEAFLAGGVANFLGTHWPVGDDSALAFSQELYGALVGGETLGDAVLAARRRIEALPSIDWADYVHYGSPEFRLLQER